MCDWEGTPQEYLKHYDEKHLGRLGETSRGIFPFLSATANIPDSIPNLIYRDDLIKILFSQLNEHLQGPPTEFIIKHVTTPSYAFDAYAGFQGKIVFSINDRITSPYNLKYFGVKLELKNDDIAYALIHEILHKKYPEATEKTIEEQLLPQAWKQLYPNQPNPSKEYKRMF